MSEEGAVNISKYDQVLLSELSLPDYEKLIKKITNLNGFTLPSGEIFLIKTIGDIAKLDPELFAKLPAVGSVYVNNLIALQKELPSFLNIMKPIIQAPLALTPQVALSATQLEMSIEQVNFPIQYQKLLKRMPTVVNNVTTVQDLLTLEPTRFGDLPTVGKLYVQSLIALQLELPHILATQKHRLASLNLMEFSEIDNALIEDAEAYLWTLDEIRLDIALSRWGFNFDHRSLEEVGSQHGVTRERIRQIEKRINQNLLGALRIPPKILWGTIREKMTENLTALLPNLAKCFATEKLFYAFIELCCQIEKDSILKIALTEIPTKILAPLFCNTPSPIAQDVIINELTSNYGYSKASAIHGIKQLAKLNKIVITEQGIYPKKLGRAEAVAHVLSSHPEGLPWKDIVRIANAQGCTSKPLDESRQTPAALGGSEYVYSCGIGTYRNLLFLDFERLDIPKTMQHLIDYFYKNKISALHLHDYFHQTKNQLDQIGYYTLRHLVREYGEEYGLYFDGKSNVDGVSLDSDSKRITQADVIIKVLNESKFAMTKQEIAERLKSKSTGHAGFYISNLMEEGKVVRVDKLVYTTPEKAFRDIDTDAAMQVIREIINVPNTIVEADVFREYVNMELNLSYSKYIYAALANTHLKELGWHRHNTLFSKNPIPYKNLLDASKQLCNPTLSNNENTEILKNAIWLTDAVVGALVNQWRTHLKVLE